MSDSSGIHAMPEFLAHALALENESVDRYEELADTMEVHNNRPVAALFRRLAELGRLHAAEVARAADGLVLPAIRPWEFRWSGDEGPETGGFEATHYLMTPVQALELARRNEQSGQAFYAQVAQASHSDEVRALAKAFADEEAGHVAALDRWLAQAPAVPSDWLADLDPPNAPE